MDAFVWDQNFITGLPEVDQQHHALVDMFNELHQRLFVGQGIDWVALETVFRRLLEYAAKHFVDEERLMQQAGVDLRHINAHERAHRDFVHQVRLMWDMRQSLQEPAETIVGFLTSWLGIHILGVDQQMARQVNLIGQGKTGAQAFDAEEQRGNEGTRALLKMVANLHGVLAKLNDDLMLANQELESRVQKRTAQLATANKELRGANRRLQTYSRTDDLLQIPNRKHFDERLRLEVARARRLRRPLALLMLDVDFFKQYNDTYGHQAGDVCLQAVAAAVQQALRRETDFLGRYGGEELVVLLPDTDSEGAHHVGLLLLQAVRQLALPHATSDAASVVTLSAGVCSATPKATDGGIDLISNADAALYEAKRGGRNRVVLAGATA
jgi:diguanylate cyclase (GGDEF)-like protein/hemerythrin-like metal-binding protein